MLVGIATPINSNNNGLKLPAVIGQDLSGRMSTLSLELDARLCAGIFYMLPIDSFVVHGSFRRQVGGVASIPSKTLGSLPSIIHPI